MSEIRTLRPGLLVSLNTSIRGNVQYFKIDLEGRHLEANGEERSRYEVTKTVFDPVEQAAAVELRGKVAYLIRRQCVTAVSGLLCPEDNADALLQAVAQAREMANEFNAKASLTRVSVNVIIGRVAADDVTAVQAIGDEVRTLLDDIQVGLQNLDAAAVRKLCNNANRSMGIGNMLSDSAKQRLDDVISVARKAANKIVKAGETAAVEIDRAALEQIDKARTTFLDIDGTAIVAVPAMDGRNLDLCEV